MKQLSLLAALLVVAACSEAPTAPGATADSDVAQVVRRDAGFAATLCPAGATYTTWTFLATVTGATEGVAAGAPVTGGGGIVALAPGAPPGGGGGGIPAPMFVGDTATTTLEFCAVSTTTEETPIDLTVGNNVSVSVLDNVGTITPAAGGATFAAGGSALNFSLTSSSYPALPAASESFGTLQVNSGWSLTFNLSIPLGPQTKDECKNDGWMTPAGKYKNQGQCVSEMARLKK